MIGMLIISFTASADEKAISLEQASEIFAQRGFVTDIQISPDGKHYFVVAEQFNDQTLSIFELETNELVRVVDFDRRWKADSTAWISNEHIAIGPAIKPLGDYRRLSTSVLVVIDLKNYIKPVFGPLTRDRAGARRTLVQDGSASLMDPLLDEPGWIKVEIAHGFKVGFADLEFKTGKIRNLKWGPNWACRFVMDENANVELCSTQQLDSGRDREKKVYEIYSLEDDKWNRVYEGPAYHTTVVSSPIKGTNKFLAAKESPSSRLGLYEFDLASREFTELYTDTDFDFDIRGVGYDREAGISSIAVHNPLPNYLYLEPAGTLAKVHQQLVASFPEHYVSIRSHTQDMSKLVFSVSSSQNPGTYYLFDRSKKEVRYLADVAPDIAALPLERMEPFSFVSTDGLKIHGLFTPGVAGGIKGSVTIAHGGPHGPYDPWMYRGEVHFFSQLGYNVIQVNFRGSGGFGRNFEEAGYLEWSGKMIDDIIEGTRFISDQKNLPDARCIYGGSYGGFAAASAAFRYPDFFDCAAGHVGVYDMALMYSTGDIEDRKAGIDYLNRVLGADKEKRRRDSPVNNVEKIEIPMLLTHGNQDYRADVLNSKRMERRLKAAGKEVETMYVMRETHGFASIENEKKRLSQLGAFVERHTAPKINLASLQGGR